MELTSVQRDLLNALININHVENRAVKGEEIAEIIDRNPGTVRNQMQSLKTLGLVEGLAGPKGGYRATAAAYEALSIDRGKSGDEVVVPVVRNGVAVEGVSATEIIFDKVMHSKHCGGIIRIIGNIRDFSIEDEIEIGPTPVNKLHIRGKVVGRDDTMSRLILEITGLISVPKIPVKKIARRAVRISPTASLQEAARMLIMNGVQQALVEDGYLGLIHISDIAREIAEGRTDLKAEKIMTRNYLTVNSEELIFEAIKIMSKTGTKQLVVSEKGVPWGIVTHEDLIKSLSPPS